MIKFDERNYINALIRWMPNLCILFVLFESCTSVHGQTFFLKSNERPIVVKEQNDVPLSYELNTYKYARVTYEGVPLKLEVQVSGFEFDDEDWDISPHSYNIKGSRTENLLSFTIDRVGYVVIRFSKDQDFTKRLVIFVEPPEVLPQREVINITTEYAVDKTGQSNETLNIQKALDDISGSDKVLLFPAGLYKSSMLEIKSNSKIHLSKGARIIADASDLDSYKAKNGGGINHFILIDGAHDIEITGLGILDGNGTEILGVVDPDRVKAMGGMRLLFMLNANRVSFDGIVLKDPAGWNTHMMGCDDVSFRSCKMINSAINNYYFGSLDGWDPDASKRVLIENCFGWAGDDNVAIKCTGYGDHGVYDNVEDITVRSCVFLTRKTSLKIGTETMCESMKRIIFEDNDVIEADRVMGINVRDKATVEDVVYRDIRSEYFFPDRRQMPINFYITKREKDQTWSGRIRNTRVENCSFEQMFPKKIQFTRGVSFTEEEDFQVTISNLTISGDLLDHLDPKYFNLSKCNGNVEFEN